MKTIITPDLVRHYLRATGAACPHHVDVHMKDEAEVEPWHLIAILGQPSSLSDGVFHLGMLNAAEMFYASAKVFQDEAERLLEQGRPVTHMAAKAEDRLECARDLVKEAGVDPERWEATREPIASHRKEDNSNE